MKEIDEEKLNRVLKIADILSDGNTSTFDGINMLQSAELIILLKAVDDEKDEERRKALLNQLRGYLNEKNDELYYAVVEYFNK